MLEILETLIKSYYYLMICFFLLIILYCIDKIQIPYILKRLFTI